MRRLLTILLLVMVITMRGAVGEWNVYPAFGEITEIEKAGNMTYVLASGNLYSYNAADNSVTTYDKSKTLNDCDIVHIGWCASAQRLVIVYSNQNIDLLENNGNTINIADYYIKAYTGDKTVNGLNIYGQNAYLSTGFGIVKINVKEAHISDTYNIGISVNWTHVDSRNIYAESAQAGQYSAPLGSNLLDKASWSRTGNYQSEGKTLSPELVETARKYRPDGPESNFFGYMKFQAGRLYTVGGYNGRKSRPAYVQIKEGNEWTVISNNISYISERPFLNAFMINIDPKDKEHWYVAARTGLYEYYNNKVIKDYYCANSPLQRAATVTDEKNMNYTLVPSAIADKDGNLWVTNAIAPEANIFKLDKDGNWTKYPHRELFNTEKHSWERTDKAFFDSRGLMWFPNNDWRTPGLACYNTDTDELKTYTSIHNQDATQVFFFYGRCAMEDKEGNIWFCTDVGPLELLAEDIEKGNTTFQQVKVPRNDGTNLADYLLAGIDCTAMAIDGGNRKWFGTTGHGVYVIDSDNITQLYHFTADESPLLSDNIESIAIDDATGEVFIATDKGLCSYVTDATAEAEEMENGSVYAYPNPVNPDYYGPITITGLTYRANVKIVTSSGQLVAEGQSNGGTFVWDGNDLSGRRVASGVYMVLAATEDGKKGVVCKIGLVR